MSHNVHKLSGDAYVRVAQQASAAQALVTKTSDAAAIAALTFSNPVADTEAVALRTQCEALAADVAALIVLTNQLRADLVELALIKGSAP